MVAASPYGLGVLASCATCNLQGDRCFRQLSVRTLQALETVKYASAYPAGAVLFVEGQAPRGVFMLCQGRVKLSVCSADGKTLILKIAEAGQILGLSATVSGRPYELTAETVDPCQINAIKREDFLHILSQHGDLSFRVAEQLCENYNTACHEIHSLTLSHSAVEKLSKLLLDWSSRSTESARQVNSFKLALTHEEITQMIGSSRETVTRLFSELRRQQIIQVSGATLLIRKRPELESLANPK